MCFVNRNLTSLQTCASIANEQTFPDHMTPYHQVLQYPTLLTGVTQSNNQRNLKAGPTSLTILDHLIHVFIFTALLISLDQGC